MKERFQYPDTPSSLGDGSEESTPRKSLEAKYGEIFHRLTDALQDIRAKHREVLELRSRQTADQRASNPIPPVLSWYDHRAPEQSDDTPSTPEPLP